MPFCTHCGGQTGTGDRYCARCGAGQDAAPPVPPVTEAVPPLPGTVPPPGAFDSVPPTPGIYATHNPRLRPNIAALLCYIPSFGWMASVFFLTADNYRRNRYVHFHALQGLFLFIAYFLVRALGGFGPGAILDPFSSFGIFGHQTFYGLLHVALIIIQVVGIAKTARGEPYHLPIIGDIAERSQV